MPKIPRYQQRELASSVVGTPGVDTSGAKLAEVAGGVADSALKTFGEMAIKRQEAANVAAANKSLIDFDLVLEGAQLEHEKNFAGYRGAPTERMRAFKDRAFTLLDEHLTGIDSTPVRQTVQRLGQTYIQQRIAREVQTASQQQAVNAFDDVVSSANTLSIEARKAGRSNDLARFDELFRQADGVRVAAGAVLSPEQQQKLGTDVPKSLATGYLFGLNETDPGKAAEILESDRFKRIFSPDEVKTLIQNAYDAQSQKEKRAEDLLKIKSDATRYQFADRILKGEVVEMSEITAAVDSKLLSPDDGEDLQKMIRNAPPIDSNPYVLGDLNSRLVAGTLTAQEVVRNSGKLSQEDQRKLILSLTSDIADNPAMKRARALLDSEFDKQAFGIRQLRDEQLFNVGMDELIQRAQFGKENPLVVVEDVIKRVKIQKQKNVSAFFGREMAQALGGDITPEKIQKQRDLVVLKFQNGETTEEYANYLLQQLDELEKTL